MRECVTHHYACDCREEKFKEMENKLKEALSIIEELKASNDFYANVNNYKRSNKTAFFNISCADSEEIDFEYKPLGYSYKKTEVAGKLARKTKQSTDQRIEKLKKEIG